VNATDTAVMYCISHFTSHPKLSHNIDLTRVAPNWLEVKKG